MYGRSDAKLTKPILKIFNETREKRSRRKKRRISTRAVANAATTSERASQLTVTDQRPPTIKKVKKIKFRVGRRRSSIGLLGIG